MHNLLHSHKYSNVTAQDDNMDKQLMELVQARLGDLGNDADAMELVQALVDDLRLQQRPQLALENNKAILAQLTVIMA